MLSRDDIIRMAREAGFRIEFDPEAYGHEPTWFVLGDRGETLERFFALVAAAERTRACRIVTGLCISDNNAREICEAIRSKE